MALNADAAKTGNVGEDFVAKLITKRAWQILDRNWRIKEGELDIVAIDQAETIIFIEVKTRTSTSYGNPLEAITPEKAQRLQRLALAWLATHQRLGNPFRIDAVGVLITRSGEFIVDYREAVL